MLCINISYDLYALLQGDKTTFPGVTLPEGELESLGSKLLLLEEVGELPVEIFVLVACSLVINALHLIGS